MLDLGTFVEKCFVSLSQSISFYEAQEKIYTNILHSDNSRENGRLCEKHLLVIF
jgi:hypothetical protein